MCEVTKISIKIIQTKNISDKHRRDDEFSPLKNADSAGKDCPKTARESLYALHRKYLEHAGAKMAEVDNNNEVVVEISPLVSFTGEGLDQFRGKAVTYPFTLSEDKQTNGV